MVHNHSPLKSALRMGRLSSGTEGKDGHPCRRQRYQRGACRHVSRRWDESYSTPRLLPSVMTAKGGKWERMTATGDSSTQTDRIKGRGSDRIRPPRFFSFYFSIIFVSDPPILPETIKGRGLPHAKGMDRPNNHTHARTHAYATRDLGSPLPLSPICNPYYKLECKSTSARTGRRDILPEPV